jgi:excisionase family DNA binding protein
VRYLTVDRAAERLGVTPRRVRALIEAGELPAMSGAREWLLDPAAVERRARTARRAGRPLSPTTAWEQIRRLEDRGLPRSPGERDRIRRQLSTRARYLASGTHPQTLRDLIETTVAGECPLDTSVGGRHAAWFHRLGVDRHPDISDVYVSATSFARLVEHGLVIEAENPNLGVYIVGDEAWPLVTRPYVQGVVAWCDLADAGDRSESIAANHLLRSAEIPTDRPSP